MILATLQVDGTFPSSRDLLRIVAKGPASWSTHFFSRIEGQPSGPDADVAESSCIAALTSSHEKLISDIEAGSGSCA